MNPLISIVIPSYNASKYIHRCLYSILDQIDEINEKIEVVVVNDGSIDNSSKIINKLSKEYPNRLKIYTKENGGAGSARNLGLTKASKNPDSTPTLFSSFINDSSIIEYD